MTEVSADLSSTVFDNGDVPPAERESQDAPEQEALLTAFPDVEIAPRAEQESQDASEQEAPGSQVTGVPLPAELDPGFLDQLESLGEPEEAEDEELGTGRPLPSHLDACFSTEVFGRTFPGEQRTDTSSGVLGPEASCLLGDAVSDSVLSMGRSTVDISLPWETAGMNLIFREEDPVDVMLASLPSHVPVPAPHVQPEELVKEPPAKRMKTYPESGECFRGAIAVRGYDNDDDKVEGVWRRALEKWLVVVTECPSASLIGDRVSRMSTTEAAETLRELFGRKSAATVLKRGSALVAFIAWCRKFFRDEEPMPFRTLHMEGYLRHLKKGNRPASAFTSFQEAVNFATHVVGVSVAVTSKGQQQGDSVWSPWCNGIIGQALQGKAERKQATVLSVHQVAALEYMLQDESLSAFDRYACGALLFGIFSRSRVSDLRKTYSWYLDFDQLGDGGDGFIECRTRDHKTANLVLQSGVSMPLVAPALGVTSASWAVRWAKVAEEVGLGFSGDRKGPVLPAPDQRGGWTKRSVEAGEVTKWLHALLARSGNAASPGTTSHTVKSTVLSWCAKYGMARHPRLQLGHHTSGDGSLDTYGRDTLAPALLQLTSMLDSIRRGMFLPDLTRSGRFRKRTSIKVESSDEEAVTAEDLGEVEDVHSSSGATGSFLRVEADRGTGDQPEASLDSDSSSSEDSSSEAGHEDAWVVGEDFRNPESKPATWKPDTVMYRHVRTGVVHIMAAGSSEEIFTCGRLLTKDHVEVADVPFLELRKCKQCEAGKPVRDIGGLTAAINQLREGRRPT